MKTMTPVLALSMILIAFLFHPDISAQQVNQVELKIERISGDTIYFGNGIYAYPGALQNNTQSNQAAPDSSTIFIKSNGYVGIGTSTPNRPLDVAKSGGIRLSLTDSISSANEIYFGDNGQIRSLDNNHRLIFDRQNDIFEIREYGDIHFSTGSLMGERTSKVVINSDGRLGIGTDSPFRPLHIESPGGIQLNLTDSISPDNEIFFLDNGQIRSANNDHRIIFDRTNNIFEVREYGDIHFSTGSLGERTSKVIINAAGNVGIGELNPTEALVVNGRVKVSTMDTVTSSDLNLVWEADGTIGVRRYQVGDFVQGGIVFWVDESGEHGLVCAKANQSLGMRWSAGTFGNTQAKGNGPYSGESNSSIIISGHVAIGDDGDTYAARTCAELEVTEGGVTYGDWYLPSQFELQLMYQNLATIDSVALANGGDSFDLDYYWSSREFSNNSAYGLNFLNGQSVIIVTKDSEQAVRAVRAF